MKKKKTSTYLQNLNSIFSNTRTGPVLPRMVRGWPANSEYAIPVSEAPNSDSMALWETRGREKHQPPTASSQLYAAVHRHSWQNLTSLCKRPAVGRRGGFTIRPSVASPSSPPKVMTGDMQAQ